MEATRYITFPASQDFFPISISCLSLQGQYPVDLFLKVSDTYYLFKRKEEVRHRQAVEFLRAKNVTTVYVRAEDIKAFEDAFMSYLPETLQEVEAETQANVLKSAGEQVVQTLFTSPEIKKTVGNAQTWVNQVFLSLESNPTMLYQLIALLQHDEYTYSHSLGVSLFAMSIAKESKAFSVKQIEEIGLAGLLHDVGKREIPLSILNKPGPLTEEEWQIMRKHPVRGAELLRELSGFSTYDTTIIDVVYGHHELLDGSGYPKGLKGTEISLAQRIVTLADIFSALTTDRPYAKALSSFQAIALLRDKFFNKVDRRLLKMLIKLMGNNTIETNWED